MRVVNRFFLLLLAISLMWTPRAHAGEPSSGLAVLAREGASEAAWSLAKALYARDGLRPSFVDEAHARVLAGEPAPKEASDGTPPASAERGRYLKELADLAETRAAIHGDDAPSRQLLTSIATTYQLRGILVVEMSPQAALPPRARARLFFPKTGFDAAEYLPDEAASGAPSWSGTVRSLERAYVGSPDTLKALPPPVPVKAPEAAKRAFYASPWFWGAVGAAVFAGGGLYLATRDNSPSTIHLQVQVPK